MKIYLAGPGVFRRDAKAWGSRLAAACAANELQGLYPLDAEVPGDLPISAQRHWIFASNCALIRQCDAVFADLRAFRSGSEPDSGTAFEVGFAHALGKPVWLWLPDCHPGVTLIERVSCVKRDAAWIDAEGMLVEDFGAPLNLMLWDAAVGKSFDPEPEVAVASLAAWLAQHSIQVSRET